jgi:hypothetical protein
MGQRFFSILHWIQLLVYSTPVTFDLHYDHTWMQASILFSGIGTILWAIYCRFCCKVSILQICLWRGVFNRFIWSIHWLKKGTGSRGGFVFCWHAWTDLGIIKGLQVFQIPLFKKYYFHIIVVNVNLCPLYVIGIYSVKISLLLIKGTVLRDRFRKCWRKLTDLGLNKGRGWF